MKRFLWFTSLVCFLHSFAWAQQKKAAISKLAFCGYSMKDSTAIRQRFQPQLDFIKISDGDTVVDIGSSSGAFVGLLNAITETSRAHFILVDIDSNCLNAQKVDRMKQHYELVKGRPFANSISFVNNSVDSLWLPAARFKKALLLNTLHEIPNHVVFIRQVSNILRPGAELIVGELMPTEKYKVHFGCHRPLITEQALKAMMAEEGFIFQDRIINPGTADRKRNPYYLFRFLKQ